MIAPSDPRKSQLAFGIALVLVAFSVRQNKLTLPGVVAAFLTACLHISFPSVIPFACLVTFFLSGVLATRVGKAAKSGLTVSSTGGSGAEGPRNAVQVLANSAPATLLILAAFAAPRFAGDVLDSVLGPGTAVTVGDEAIVRQVAFASACAYAAAAADTLSSELGILASSSPFTIFPPFRRVPRGTNGGVTVEGLAAGLLGGAVVASVYWKLNGDLTRAVAVAVLGLAGSVIDSIYGALFQATVEDKKSGRVVEGANGKRVMVTSGGSRVQRGRDLLNNNAVNFLMASTVGVVGLVVDRGLA